MFQCMLQEKGRMSVATVIWKLLQTYHTKASNQVHHGRKSLIQLSNQVSVVYTVWYYKSPLIAATLFCGFLIGKWPMANDFCNWEFFIYVRRQTCLVCDEKYSWQWCFHKTHKKFSHANKSCFKVYLHAKVRYRVFIDEK
jgi:hypothetical protein